jgi:hypothetical protein
MWFETCHARIRAVQLSFAALQAALLAALQATIRSGALYFAYACIRAVQMSFAALQTALQAALAATIRSGAFNFTHAIDSGVGPFFRVGPPGPNFGLRPHPSFPRH